MAENNAPAASAKKARAPKPDNQSPEARVKTLSRLTAAMAAIAIAGAGFGAYSLASTASEKAEMAAGAQAAIVATSDVKAGQTISADQMGTQQVPSAYRTTGSVADPALVVGKVALVDIPAGTQVAGSMVSGEANASTLAASIEQGKEAVSIATDDESGLAGQLKPGDKVRLVTTVDDVTGEVSAETIASEARVLAIGTTMDGSEAGKYASISVEVSASEADAVRAAQADQGVTAVLLPAEPQAGAEAM